MWWMTRVPLHSLLKHRVLQGAVANVHLANMTGDCWGNLFLSFRLKRTEPESLADNTRRHINVALSCHAIVHLETVMSGLGAVFRSYSRARLAQTGRGISCVNHRELQDNRSGRFRLEPD